MDAVYAWDQPHFDIHVPDRADRPDRAVTVFQTSLETGRSGSTRVEDAHG
jgi:hypothetical protein